VLLRRAGGADVQRTSRRHGDAVADRDAVSVHDAVAVHATCPHATATYVDLQRVLNGSGRVIDTMLLLVSPLMVVIISIL